MASRSCRVLMVVKDISSFFPWKKYEQEKLLQLSYMVSWLRISSILKITANKNNSLAGSIKFYAHIWIFPDGEVRLLFPWYLGIQLWNNRSHLEFCRVLIPESERILSKMADYDEPISDAEKVWTILTFPLVAVVAHAAIQLFIPQFPSNLRCGLLLISSNTPHQESSTKFSMVGVNVFDVLFCSLGFFDLLSFSFRCPYLVE